LNNFRFFPLNHIAAYVLAFTPPLVLGFSQHALLAYATLTLPIVLFQHSNIRFNFGVLNYMFSTNELHRWHHSAAPKEGTKNLRRALVFWDQVFGTFLNPTQRSEPKSIGLFAASRSYPKAHHLLRQITWHFCKTCCA
jgi:sterol desaturase/sphingolipid hydroxylase (fatty acid hydroxylase superfamily)